MQAERYLDLGTAFGIASAVTIHVMAIPVAAIRYDLRLLYLNMLRFKVSELESPF